MDYGPTQELPVEVLEKLDVDVLEMQILCRSGPAGGVGWNGKSVLRGDTQVI